MKFLEMFLTIVCSIVGISIFGAFFDAITSTECAFIIVACLFTMAVVGQLPIVKMQNNNN